MLFKHLSKPQVPLQQFECTVHRTMNASQNPEAASNGIAGSTPQHKCTPLFQTCLNANTSLILTKEIRDFVPISASFQSDMLNRTNETGRSWLLTSYFLFLPHILFDPWLASPLSFLPSPSQPRCANPHSDSYSPTYLRYQSCPAPSGPVAY